MTVITGTANGEHIYASDGDDVINAGGGDDTIFAYGGNDIVSGGTGNDTFELRGWGNNKYGTLTITDFTAGNGDEDRIDLDGFSWEHVGVPIARNFGEILDVTTQVGSDTHIALTDDYTIILQNVDMNDLVADDFQNYYAYRIGTEGDDVPHDEGAGGGTFYGYGGDDVIAGGMGPNTIYGGDGNDTITTGGSGSTLDGGQATTGSTAGSGTIQSTAVPATTPSGRAADAIPSTAASATTRCPADLRTIPSSFPRTTARTS